MWQLLVLSCIVTLGATEADVKQAETEPAEAKNPIFVHRDDLERFPHLVASEEDRMHSPRLREDRIHGHSHREDRPRDDHKEERIHSHRKSHESEEALNRKYKIIERVYSPDYYEPTLVLDYRYLKTGGRDYTRGPGGQLIILPHGIRTNEHKEHKDYDSLLEFLRQKNQAQMDAQMAAHEELRERHGGRPEHSLRKRGPEMRFYS